MRTKAERGRWLVLAVAALGWVGLVGAARAGEINGRYVVARPMPTPAAAATPAASPAPVPEIYGGTVDVAARRHGYALAWRPANGGPRLHGLGLRDGDDVLGVSLSTGGAAYGVQIFHRADEGRAWRASWITSIDGAGSVGEIEFRTDGPLLGKHPATCRRPGAGSFEATVEITPKGGDYLLTFYLEHSLLYRGLGVLLDGNRLVVGWSFGSPPAVAVYRIRPDGLWTGRRVALRAGQTTVTDERLAREGADAARLLPAVVAQGNAAPGPDGGEDLPPPAFGALSPAESALLTMMEPGAPSVKMWDYHELQQRYGADGWADRWLAEQLTPEENALLRSAVRRRDRALAKSKDKAAPDPRTVGELIEGERQRTQADDE